jgi:L-cysteine desulfidase
MIKNVKSVIVPHTGGLRGLEAAAAVGILFGDADKQLEVISSVTAEQECSLAEKMGELDIKVSPLESTHLLDLVITVTKGECSASVHVEDEHTNITQIINNGKCVFFEREKTCEDEAKPDHSLLCVADIFDFAETVDISDVEAILQRQIDYNTATSREGLTNNYGARIGQLLMKRDDSIRTRAKAYAAAGSDARMSGCELPVCIISGSGNQGITASVPVKIYADEMGVSEEMLLRALLVSDLITIHQKSGIGCLSAYCGAVSAGVGAGAGICYLHGGKYYEIAHTLVNAVAIISGTICDGAKPSCAAKIAMAVEAGIMGFEMARTGRQFLGGDGIVTKGVENTIRNVGRLAKEGMSQTDKEIISIMLGK